MLQYSPLILKSERIVHRQYHQVKQYYTRINKTIGEVHMRKSFAKKNVSLGDYQVLLSVIYEKIMFFLQNNTLVIFE